MAKLDSMQITTDPLSSSDRPGWWQEQFRDNHGGAHVQFDDWSTFKGGLRVQRLEGNYRLGDWQNMEFQSDAITYKRTKANIKSDGDDKSKRVLIVRRGVLGLEQGGKSELLREGSMGVIDWGLPNVVEHSDYLVGWVLTVPGEALHIAPGAPHLSLDTTGNAVLGTVLAMAEQLWKFEKTMTADEFLRISSSMAGLLGGALDERWAPENERLAAISRDARRYIRMYSDDSQLTVDGIADHLGINRRRLERAMRLAGTSPYSFLLATRLERAIKRLTDPGHHHRSIDHIAHASGFSHVSTFSNACREKYGATPSQLRERARNRVLGTT